MTDEKKTEKKVREVARCVRTLLCERGKNIKVKDIVQLIKDQNLEDPIALSQIVSDSVGPLTIRARKNAKTPNEISRRQQVGEFIIKNYNLISDNKAVKDGLLHIYTMGRINKAGRENLKQELLAQCENVVPADDIGSTDNDSSTLDF